MNLQRFIDAQDVDYEIALNEIKSGKKRSHWIWYIFPQIDGLGLSSMSRMYAIKDIEEARAYVKNEILYNHLIEITTALLNLETNNIYDIMDDPDDMKVRSCMTLFSEVLPDNPLFKKYVYIAIPFNTYLSQKNAFLDDFHFACMQDFSHINDIYQKVENVYNEGFSHYLIVTDYKYDDKDFFMKYKNEVMSILMFEEE